MSNSIEQQQSLFEKKQYWVKVKVRVAKIPTEYDNEDFKWLLMAEREYFLFATLGNINKLKRDQRFIVSLPETYQLY
jgi:hypothetical protein